MRPTDLHFRSPKEATPGPYAVDMTSHGRFLFAKPSRSKPTLGVSKRFKEYEENARKLGHLVGPGTYSTELGPRHIKGACMYRPYCVSPDVYTTSFSYVGNHIVQDLSPKRVRRSTCSRPRSVIGLLRSAGRPLNKEQRRMRSVLD